MVTERTTIERPEMDLLERRAMLQHTRTLLILDNIERLRMETDTLLNDERAALVQEAMLPSTFESAQYLALLRYQAHIGSARQRCQDLYTACVVHVEIGTILQAGSWKDLDTNDKARERWMQLAVLDSYEVIRSRDLLRDLELTEDLVSAYLEALITIQRRELAQLAQN